MKPSLTASLSLPAWPLHTLVLLLLAFLPCQPLKALSVVPPSLARLVASSEQILRVKVAGVHCRWDDSPDGRRVIHTYVDCVVEESIQGSAPDQLQLRFLGGQVGNDQMIVHDMPSLEAGTTYILFVGQNGRAFCPLVGVMYGGYKVRRNPDTGSEHLCRLNGAPLRDPADIRTPMEESRETPADFTGMSPAAFRTAIRKEAVNVR